MKTHHGNKPIYDVRAGMANVSDMVAEAGLRVTAIHLEPGAQSELNVIKADSTEYVFEKSSVVMLCRPCHDRDFVRRNTILRGLHHGVRAIVYVGLNRNVWHHLGGFHKKFVKRQIRGIGHADEHVLGDEDQPSLSGCLVAEGAIPPLSSDSSR